MKKSLKQKIALFIVAVFMFSLVIQPGTVMAAPPEKPSIELVGQSDGMVNVVQGKTANLKITLSLSSYSGVNAKAKVNTKYYLTGQEPTSDTPSQFVDFNNGSLTFDATVTIGQNYSLGEISVPIYVQITNNGQSSAEVVNRVTDYFTVKVLPADSTAPVVTIDQSVKNAYYNANNFPSEPAYTIVEANSYQVEIANWSNAEGTHEVTVTATDASGNVGSDKATYTFDKTAPTISTQIIDGGVYNESTLKNMGEYYSVQDTNPGTETASDLVYTEGEHTATVTATDKAGNKATKTIKYVVDNTKPVITFNFNDGGFYQSKVLTALESYYNVSDDNVNADSIVASNLDLSEGSKKVTVSASDLAGNSNSQTASYTVDDTAPTVTLKIEDGKFYNKEALSALGTYYTVSDTNPEKTEASDLKVEEDGEYTVTVTAIDKAGNSTTKSVNYNVDSTMPVINFNEKLVNGGFYKSSALESIKDNFFTATDDNLVRKSDVKLDLTEGQHKITVEAVDKAGNETTAEITYTIDDTAPTISFNIENGKFYTSDNLVVLLNGRAYYSTSDKNEVVSVVCDGLNSLEGVHTLSVTAMDAAGNETTASVTYTVDNTPPTISFIIQNNSFLTSAKLAEILGEKPYYIATDNNAVSEVKADDLQDPEEGKYTLSVTAKDAAGNETTASVKYTIDNTAPEVSFNIENNSFLTSAKLAEILNGKEYYNASDANGLVEFNPPELKTTEGEHTLIVIAKDAAGNETTKSITYTVDDTKPEISTKLLDRGIYNKDTLEKMGKYYSIVETNLATESASDLDCSQGNHTATITATDKAGNTESVTINYTVDNTKPEITFTFNDKGFYQSKVLKALNSYYNVKDDNLDNESIKASELKLTEGEHSVTVSASDLAGNSNEATASYTVDDTAPVVTLKIEDGKFYNKEALGALETYYTIKEPNPLKTDASDLEVEKDGLHTATVTAIDKAGNKTTKSVNYNVDNTKPVITFDEKLVNGGYYQSSDLESIKDYFFTATDANLVSKSDVMLDLTEGQHKIIVEAIDKAGNKAIETITYTIDNTAPEVSVIGINDGQRFIAGQKVVVTWNATDTNLDSDATESITLDTATSGEKTVTIPAATDKAGNGTPAQTIKYYVYNFSGVLQPIKGDGKSSFKSGSTVPVKFQLLDGTKYITDAKANINVLKVSGTAVQPVNEVVSTSAATDGSLFRYSISDNQYIFNLSTKNYSEGQYKVEITITVDGTTTTQYSSEFTIKK